MKRTVLIAVVTLCTALPAWTQENQPNIPMKNYASGWKKADSLLKIGQPQPAEKIIDKIYNAAQEEKNVPQFIKAVIYRLRAKGSYEEEALAKNITETEELLRTATFPARNILHTIAAGLYWQYYEGNRWQFRNRTSRTPAPDTVGSLPPDDVRTLDLRQLAARCVAHYSASLEMPQALQQIPVGAYAAILEKALDSERYRPTLFDFLAFRAVAFYQNAEAGLTQPADRFVIDRAAYFAPAAAFAQQPLATADSLSFPYQSLVLLQQLIAFHLPDTMPDALVDADLWRLDFVHRKSVLPNRDSLYLQALQALETQYPDAPCSAEVAYRMAKLYNRQGDAYHPFTNPAPQWKKKEAVAVIDRAASRFPKSFGANNCLSLKNDILQPALTLSADEAATPGRPLLVNVAYRNVPKVYIKIVALDFKKELLQTNKEDRLAAYAAAKTVQIAAFDLPGDGDYQQHIVELTLPALDEGYYALLASVDGHFSKNAALVTETRIWVTNISFVKREDNGQVVVQLLDRTSGQPLSGVTAQRYTHEYNYNQQRYEVKYGETYTSGADGRITLTSAGNQHRSSSLFFTKGTDSYAGGNVYLYRYASANAPSYQTTLFTDRAIYRPGQTVYFKGVVLKWENEKAAVAAGKRQTVTFYNVNGEQISELPVTTNEFGSFAGSFIIPANGLTGQMYINAPDGNGRAYFHVEEYKRPEFEVTFDLTEKAYRLGEKVTLHGKAKAYAGSAVSNAKVTYRVVREARYPLWRLWWGVPPSSPAQEITNGETLTDADGLFAISFTAIPDAGVDRTLSPVFHYTVYASVSDVNGETHEAKTTAPIGYQALLLSTGLPEKVMLEELKEITVTATNLRGKALPVKGTLTVWKLRSPDRLLQPRRGQRPDKFILSRAEFEKLFPYSPYDEEDRIERWDREKQVFSITFDTQSATAYALPNIRQWAEGAYLVTLSATGPYGETVENTTAFTGFRANGTQCADAVLLETLPSSAQPDETVKIVAGSAYDDVQAWMEITGHNGAVLAQRLLRFSGNKQIIEIPVTEAHRGGFGVSLFFVRHNRVYSQNKTVQVPFDNKKLSLEFATFRDKLQPGQEEEWRITIKDKAGDAVAAELLASMYDASLDAFAPNQWNFFPWKNNAITFPWNTQEAFQYKHSEKATQNYPAKSVQQRNYDRLISLESLLSISYGSSRKMVRVGGITANAEVLPVEDMKDSPLSKSVVKFTEAVIAADEEAAETAPAVPLRTNFNETAFFYPQLQTNENGETVIRFTVPESLTRWNMQALAWTTGLKTGYVQKTPVTQKELMIFTNAPRFFRENDTLYFSAKLSSLSEKPLGVTAQVRFFDAFTLQEIALWTAGETAAKTVSLAAGGNSAVSWKIHIPEGLQAVTYRITATAPVEEGRQVSDGEEHTLPVLTNRMLVTESLPLPMRGAQPKQFEFTRLLHAGSSTLRNHAYVIEFTSHPVWYAVQALPYIMEYPYECAEQVFSRYCANAIAAHIANSDPKIKRVFDLWRNYQPAALQSNLEKNGELKSLLLEETPWVRDARNEAERKQRIALLFDLHRMRDEQAAAWRKMQQAQTPNGGFAWFRGGRDDRYITQHIVAGIGHLQKMNIPAAGDEAVLAKAIRYMDDRLAEDFNAIKKQADKTPQDKKENSPAYLTVHYLYARSFFTDTYPIPAEAREAFAYFKTQAAAHWTKYNNYLKGMLALALHRYNDTKAAQLILQSLSATALHSDEMGMYWRNESGWWWYQAPVETQALLIEAFDEIARDSAAVADMQTWLLKQKQTQDWKTTKATVGAVYALLKKGSQNPLTSNGRTADALYQIMVGDSLITPPSGSGGLTEAGAGYFKASWRGAEIRPSMGRISITPPSGDGGLAWGAAYWQYFEQLDKITPAATGVQINKRLYRKIHSPAGDVLTEITPEHPLKTGDKVTVRIEIRADRDMEYVHLKDMRAAAFEPVNVLSGYRRQDGLGYYESMRDAAANFFIAYLPKGTCVFEYELFATHAGEFSNGITSLQCMYAPEFTTHSEGTRVRVELGIKN
ncbi:MAG: hypothetical protein LBD87_04360 [Prevotellaceae bacterium]|jgi:hypothetical protein|nr:hypothetical protein [Prevotellaceae bacterium]